MNEATRLVVFSGVHHYFEAGEVVAHAGFVREIDIWARIFDEVLVAAPLSPDAALADAISYTEKNISFARLGPPLATKGPLGKVRLAFSTAKRFLIAKKILRPNDVVMARAPDGTGFLGVLVTAMSCHPRFAKYAAQWDGYPGEPIGYRIQRFLLRSSFFGGPVLIYGAADPARPHLVPSFTSSLSLSQWEQIGRQIDRRVFSAPHRLLAVGRLGRLKGFDILLKALSQVLDAGVSFSMDIVGDGPERETLIALSHKLGLTDVVCFRGWLGWSELSSYYSRASCLVHSSRSEGFPKVLLEAMAFGLPVIATDVGVARYILDPPQCGLLVRPGDVRGLAQTIIKLLSNGDISRCMGEQGRQRARSMVLEEMELEYRRFARSHLGIQSGTSECNA